jgi:iron complex outermembrane receptor protein
MNISYDFGEIWKHVRLNASVMCQNVFTITNYSGTDPEVSNGMDVSFYPRPRTWSLSLGLQF